MIELKDMVEQTLPERSGLIMTLADRLKEEGKKEGMKEELIKTVNVLLNKKLKANEFSIDPKRINSLKKIRDNIFDISSRHRKKDRYILFCLVISAGRHREKS